MTYEQTKELFDKAKEQSIKDDKRYFILVETGGHKKWYVIKKHPFEWSSLRKEDVLLDWREISEEEYQLSPNKG